MLKLIGGGLAGAALIGAFCGAASAGPITLNDTGFVPAKNAQSFQTIGGAANIYQTLDFDSLPANDTTDDGTGVAVMNVTSFLDPSGAKIAANLAKWSVYAVIDYAVAGEWTDITSKGAGNYASTAVTGTLELYAATGNCTFGFTPPAAGPSTVIGASGCSGAVEIAAGTLNADSLFDLDAGKVNAGTGAETGSETFNIDASLTSLDPAVLLPIGTDVIDFTIASGNGVGSNTSDRLVDAPAQYWCSNGSAGNCGSDAANFGADPAPLPEPASLALYGMGVLGFAALRRRKAR